MDHCVSKSAKKNLHQLELTVAYTMPIKGGRGEVLAVWLFPQIIF